MKKLFLLSALLLSFVTVEAVVQVNPNYKASIDFDGRNHLQNLKHANQSTSFHKKATKKVRFYKKLQKFGNRLKKRLAKRNTSFGGIFSSTKFKLGCLALLIGITLAICVNVFSLAQFLGWLAAIIGVTGLILMAIGLISYS